MKIDLDSVPSTIKNAVDHIVGSLCDEDREFIKSDMPAGCHHSAGQYVRNSWSLWELDSPIKRDAVNTYGIAHADDISGLIFEWVWAIVNQRDFDPIEHCKRYHDHWQKYGTTSLVAGGWKC